jgi:dipeptidyl aminopeptidase/acylaminoacyl peptidase
MSTLYDKAAVCSRKLNALTHVRIFFIFFILPLVSCPLWGQAVQKKDLTASDYHLWGTLQLEKIAPDENWASFKIQYENGNDTLFVKNSATNKTYHFPDARNSVFTEKNIFVCMIQNNLHILNLKTGKAEIIKSVKKYLYSKSADCLIIIFRPEGNCNKIVLRKPNGKTIKEIQNGSQFSLSPDQKTLVYSTYFENICNTYLLNLQKADQEKQLIVSGDESYKDFAWQKEGKSLAFIGHTKDHFKNSLLYYIVDKENLYRLTPSELITFPKDSYIADGNNYDLVVSDDLQSVFFNYNIKNTKAESKLNSNVEIWNANDKWVYLQEQLIGQIEKSVKIALWMPLSNSAIPVTTPELPKMILSGDQKNAFLSNPKAYEPQFEIEGPRDFYIMNLGTFERKLFLKKQSPLSEYIMPSPNGKYVAYYKENNWWVYNIEKGTHTNITQKIKIKFKEDHPLLVSEFVWGTPGWSTEDKELLLYDQYDIWAVAADGSFSRKLTHGRERKIKYRIADFLNKPLKLVYDSPASDSFNINKELILRAEGEDGKTGWFIWYPYSGEKQIIYEVAYTDQLYSDAKKQNFFYRKQRFDLSPQLIVKNHKKEAKAVFQSNPHQSRYHWGRSEIINYQNSRGENLKGVLQYPANYNKQKKYPMIVHIYEQQSRLVYHYNNPSLNNADGFNATVFTLEGYFVLLPDIRYQYGNPGLSALDCVTAATIKVIDKAIIDTDKIGLIGHSFGGYEAAFIITQTNLFKTAIAGSSITDLTSFFLTVNQNTGKPDMWRFQNQQWWMGKTPFEAPEVFHNNSPVHNAQTVNIPLLLWSGKADKQIDVRQSLEYYLAMRRLGKKNILLLYPNEGHVFTDKENQIDLSLRLQQWFDYYLKEGTSAQWISVGVQQ